MGARSKCRLLAESTPVTCYHSLALSVFCLLSSIFVSDLAVTDIWNGIERYLELDRVGVGIEDDAIKSRPYNSK